jgi:hypothetical protein
MVTNYGSFPGVRVEVGSGGITSVSIGEQEKLVIFGEPDYANDSTITGDGDADSLDSSASGSFEDPTSINARREADQFFGSNSQLARSMRDAISEGANIDYLYGVAPVRYNVAGEIHSSQSGTLSNAPLWEEDVSDDANIASLQVKDTGAGTVDNVRYTYEPQPTAPSDSETVVVNPHTGEFAGDSAPDSEYEFDYKYVDWTGALNATPVSKVVNENETGIFAVMNESDLVASELDSVVSDLRKNYKLINGLSGAEHNAAELVQDDSDNYIRRDALIDAINYDASTVNNSVDSDYFFKLAPVREEGTKNNILGGASGLFAGNEISNPIYNDPLENAGTLEQSLTKTQGGYLRDENVIPVRQAGTVRVKDNLSTSSADDDPQTNEWERDFWRRRIVDRVILIAKQVGDEVVGNVNDPDTQGRAGRLIRAELRNLVDDRLLQPNGNGETNWFVDVYRSSTDKDEIKIDLGVTPYGIVKRVETTVTVDR